MSKKSAGEKIVRQHADAINNMKIDYDQLRKEQKKLDKKNKKKKK